MNTAIDVGTSAVKAARFDEAGHRVAEAVRSLPAPVRDGLAVTQDLDALFAAADAVRDLVGAGATGLAVTTQRDTAVVDGVLVSWLDGRAAASGSLWDAMEVQDPRVRGLASALIERWTGRAAETEASLPAPLRSGLDAHGLVGPDVVELGEPAGQWEGVPVYPTAGDKNCALLGNAVEGSIAGLSLGSAVSLGLRASAAPKAMPGVFLSRAAVAGAWDVETGLIAGMSARFGLREWLPMDQVPAHFVEDVWVLPHFAGALDRSATGVIVGLRADTPPVAIAAAWTQGVVAELVRLRGALEQTAGREIRRIRVSGGGAQPGWDQLVADGFGVPVDRVHGRFAGCRGAIDAVRIARGMDRLPPPSSFPTAHPENPERFARWVARYVELFDKLA